MTNEIICPNCKGTGKIDIQGKELCLACGTTDKQLWCKHHLEVQKELLEVLDASSTKDTKDGGKE